MEFVQEDLFLVDYFKELSTGASKKSLPNFVWDLSERQSQILLNSLFGLTGLKSFRYGSSIIAEAITLTGQRIITSSAKYVNTEMNKEMLCEN